MPSPRSSLVNVETTPYYHCVSRCVRRAFLCGVDFTTQKDYEHRRQWFEDRILELAAVFAVDVCAYAVMSNHLHVVLHLNPNQAAQWTDLEVVQRWHLLFSGKPISRLYASGVRLSSAQQSILNDLVTCWRERLSNLSWFMRCLNEYIAVQANKEDKCKGRFWEGRFKSQALLDEAALAACMAYVDLNPIRAGIAETPERSDYTSIKRRIQQLLACHQDPVPFAQTDTLTIPPQPPELAPFVGNPSQDMPQGLPFVLADYIELVELTGRCLRDDKKGHIHAHQLPILERLGICPDNWLEMSRRFTTVFHGAVGHEHLLSEFCEHLELKRRANLHNCERLLA